MSTAHELVTIGLGNYGVLTAAHWCNATSKFDQEHDVLYMESRLSSSGSAIVRVPRMLLLDFAGSSEIVSEVPLDDPDAMADPTPLGADLSADVVADQLAEQREQEDQARVGKEGELCDPPPLFRHGPLVTPWDRYVSVPLHPRTKAAVKLTVHQHAGGLSRFHSFGFGMNSLLSASPHIAQFTDDLRWFLERCDQCQGIQAFVDCDSAFGGLLQALKYRVEEEHGALPLTAVSVFPYTSQTADGREPTKNSDVQHDTNEFGGLLRHTGMDNRERETHLNRLLATQVLSGSASIYLPFEVGAWTGRGVEGALENDVLSAAAVAAVADTALYGLRSASLGEPDCAGTTMASLASILRPEPSMRVCSLFSTVTNPTWVNASSDTFSDALRRIPLFTPSAYPGLTYQLDPSLPLHQPECPAGHVLSHALTLRGFATLRDEERVPRPDALSRYVQRFPTEKRETNLVAAGYPVSGTMPARLLPTEALVDPAVSAPLVAKDASVRAVDVSLVKAIPQAVHVVNTYGAAAYLRRICRAAEPIIRFEQSTIAETYELEKDEWREVMDGMCALRDDYDHAEPDD